MVPVGVPAPMKCVCISGLTLSAILAVVYSLMENLGPWWFIVSNLSFSFTGGFNVLTIGAMCFISDVTNKDNRSFRWVPTESVPSNVRLEGRRGPAHKTYTYIIFLAHPTLHLAVKYLINRVCKIVALSTTQHLLS